MPPKGLGLGEPEHAELAQLLEHLMRRGKISPSLPLVDMRIDLGVDEFLQLALQFFDVRV